jgi:hypothetical protein
MTDYDVVYFLTCVPVDANNNVIKDPQKKCRSAVMHFGKANLDTFNTGELPNPKTDEFAFVTKDCQRVWEGFMYGKYLLSC